MNHARLGAVTALAAAVLLTATACTTAETPGSGSDEMLTIGIAEIISIPPIDDNVAAFKAELASLGYVEGENVTYVEQNAQGQASSFSLVTNQIMQEEPDLVYALGTPLIVSVVQAAGDVPVLFGIMTDPVAAGVMNDVDEPDGTVTGTSDYIPAPVYFDAFQDLFPDAHTIGFIGNPAEANTQATLDEFETEADARGLELTFAPVADSSKVQLALESLRGNVDVLTFTADNTVSSALESVVKQATAMDLPVIASQTDTAALGGLAGIGLDWAAAGRVSAQQAADILGGDKKISQIPVWYPSTDGVSISVSAAVAEQFGVDVTKLGSQYTVIE